MKDRSRPEAASTNPTKQATAQRGRRDGFATVLLRDGRVYVGRATFEGGALTIDGRRREWSGPSHAARFRYYERTLRTVPWREVREVRWGREGRRRAA
jgi:hypothetical protein